ncbi:hypothetical protein CFP56_040964 [Quercus suber]|uniref:Uncharacterized protein n=1 Tax=Quercus suber TaxID=58331 RepID=A0AAW0IWY2_QUESU|nr:hypothetical protein CFP56_37985 [Quercus suber]
MVRLKVKRGIQVRAYNKAQVPKVRNTNNPEAPIRRSTRGRGLSSLQRHWDLNSQGCLLVENELKEEFDRMRIIGLSTHKDWNFY